MNNNDGLAIVFTCDEGYMFPTGMAIYSLLISKRPESSYRIYVLVDKIDIQYRSEIESLDRPDFRIIFREIENLDKYTSLANANRLPVSALYKFAIPDMIKEESVCLSLDGDIIVKYDLAELAGYNLAEIYVAAVKDSPKTLDDYSEKKHKLHPGIFNAEYFNGGVLLLNLKKMREDDIPEKLCEYRKNGYNQHFSMNQDTFNAVMYGHVKLLPFCYNTGLHVFRYIQNEKKFRIMKEYYAIEEYKTEEEILEEAKIIHFTGKGKPWKYYDVFYADRYRELYESSPFYENKWDRVSYYNDKVRKTINDIYESKDYKIGYYMMLLPRKIRSCGKWIKDWIK